MLSPKNKLLIAILALFLLLALALYITHQNYARNLTRVVTVEPIKSALRTDIELMARWEYANEITKSASCRVVVESICKKKGTKAEPGERLLRVNSELLQQEYYNLLVQRKEIEKNIKHAKEEELESLELEAAMLDNQMTWAKKVISANGYIYAESTCIVRELESVGHTIEPGYPLYYAMLLDDTARLHAAVSDEDAKLIHTGDSFTETENGMSAVVESVVFEPETNGLECLLTSEELDSTAFDCPVHLERTVETEEYQTVLPMSALKMIDRNNAMAYCVRKRKTRFGEEAYVFPVSLLVLDHNKEWVAVAYSINDPIVAYYSDTLVDGQAVRVLE